MLDARGHLADALAAVENAIGAARDNGNAPDLAYALVRRASLRGQLGMWEETRVDLDEAKRLAEDGDTPLADCLPRIVLCRGLLEAMQGDWREASRQLAAALAQGGKSDAMVLEVPALVTACEVDLELGNLERASERCRRALDHPRALFTERVHARVALARTLVARGQGAEAEREARRALDEAEHAGMPLAAAKAAGVLLGLSGSLRDADRVRERGRLAWRRYIEAAPEERRDALENRPDLREIVRPFVGERKGRGPSRPAPKPEVREGESCRETTGGSGSS